MPESLLKAYCLVRSPSWEVNSNKNVYIVHNCRAGFYNT